MSQENCENVVRKLANSRAMASPRKPTSRSLAQAGSFPKQQKKILKHESIAWSRYQNSYQVFIEFSREEIVYNPR